MSSFRKPIPCQRPVAGSNVNGRWVSGGPATPFTILASVQPASGKDLLMVPENRRSGSVYALFTDTAMRTLDEEGQTQPDLVTLHDGVYEATHLEVWQNNVIPHYKILVTKPPVGVPPP